ncbi:VTT domain-containing protein [Thermodesulfobacteriota bacterium B35]
MAELLAQLISWIGAHPHLAGMAIFVVAFAESMAVIGLLVPGAALMLASGALIAAGALSFWPTMAWAAAGAMLADGLSFWLGHRYREDIRSFRLLAKHPHMLARGERFFRHHGGKSVFIGRFVGPVRPVIPIVAGMLGMRPLQFAIYNVLSGLLWAPAYLLPGMAFGASLSLAGEVAGRLAMLLGTVVLGGWLVFSLSRRLVRYGLQRFPAWEEKFFRAVRRSPLIHHWLGGLLSRELSLLRPILFFSGLFFVCGWLFLKITVDVLHGRPLVLVDQYLFNLLQGLRTPWGDTLMILLTMSGDGIVSLFLVVIVCGWLLWKRQGYSARFLAITAGGGFLLALVVKNITRIPRPLALYQGGQQWAFPSSHATMAVVVYGFLALLCGRELPPGRRWLPGALATLFITAIGFSRLYLGAHWFSDVAAGYALGTAWLILLALSYFHRVPPCSCHGLCRVVLSVFLLVTVLYWGTGFERNRQRYQVQPVEVEISFDGWLDSGWQRMPVTRQDLAGEREQFFNLQYVGDTAWLEKDLESHGWRRPVPLGPATCLRWLATDADPMGLPVLPQVHAGRHEKLLLVRPLPDAAASFLALRLWPAGVRIDGRNELYLGTVTRMEVRSYLGLIRLPRTVKVVPPASVESVPLLGRKKVTRADGRAVLLLWQPGAARCGEARQLLAGRLLAASGRAPAPPSAEPAAGGSGAGVTVHRDRQPP